jgi:hypothetical protein
MKVRDRRSRKATVSNGKGTRGRGLVMIEKGKDNMRRERIRLDRKWITGCCTR